MCRGDVNHVVGLDAVNLRAGEQALRRQPSQLTHQASGQFHEAIKIRHEPIMSSAAVIPTTDALRLVHLDLSRLV